jgi:hypothetical protein
VSATTDARGGMIPRAMQVHQLASMQAAGPDKSLNAGLTGCVAIPSSSSPTLPHASSARGTQALPTTSSGLDLGSSVAASQVLGQAKTIANYSEEVPSVPG